MQPLSLITLSILGVLFSFFYYRSKSIFSSSAAHFTNNFIAVFILYLQTNNVNNMDFKEENLGIPIILISLVFAAFLIYIYWKITIPPVQTIQQEQVKEILE